MNMSTQEEKERKVESVPSTKDSTLPDEELLRQMVEFGFSPKISRIALKKTNGRNAEMAANWIIDHPEEVENLWERDEDEIEEEKAICSQKMVFVVNSELAMGVGKIAAQVGHAAVALYRLNMCSQSGKHLLAKWEYENEAKIVLRGTGLEQLQSLQKKAETVGGISTIMINDAGRTQVSRGSSTVLGLFGPVGQVDRVTGDLRLL